MALIKSSKAPAGGVVRFVLPDLEEQARARLKQAHEQAQRIIAEAHARAAEIESAAREQGEAAGWQQGRADGRDSGASEALDRRAEELRQVIATFESAAAALNDFRAQVEAAATRDAVELALAIASRITRRLGVVDPLVLLENVRGALALVGRTPVTRVAVHPSQRQTLEEALPRLQPDAPSIRHAEIVDDESILPGGCRVYTQHGHVDADLATQIERVTIKLLPPGGAPCGGSAAHGGGVEAA